MQQDALRGLLVLMSVLNTGSRHCISSNYDFTTISYDGSLYDYLFSFILEQCMLCDMCGVRSPFFQSNSVLYITIIDNASIQEPVMQGLGERLKKSFQCKSNTRSACCKHNLLPAKYLIIDVNRFSCVNNQFITNKYLVPLDPNFMLDS